MINVTCSGCGIKGQVQSLFHAQKKEDWVCNRCTRGRVADALVALVAEKGETLTRSDAMMMLLLPRMQLDAKEQKMIVKATKIAVKAK